jgi:putative endonuclease
MFGFGRLPPRRLGRRGERRAAWFYRLRGFAIVARNERFRGGEIDLVVRRGRTVVIVEVKTRQSFTTGYEAVNRAKRQRLLEFGNQYIARHPDAQLRYDILSLFWTGWRFVITHFPHAIEPVADASRPWRWRV